MSRFQGKKFYDGDTKEARVVVDIFDDEEYGWVADTAVISDGATESSANEQGMQRMIVHYNAEHGITQDIRPL